MYISDVYVFICASVITRFCEQFFYLGAIGGDYAAAGHGKRFEVKQLLVKSCQSAVRCRSGDLSVVPCA